MVDLGGLYLLSLCFDPKSTSHAFSPLFFKPSTNRILAGMIAIDDVLISDDVVESYFACNLHACKGACCWEGDWGAPLEEEERAVLEEIRPKLSPYLSKESNNILDAHTSIYYAKGGFQGTPLHADGSCVYLTRGNDGIAKCGIEQAARNGDIDFLKPVSCQLYPIRVEKLRVGFAINYDRWDICKAACAKGVSEKIGLIEFLKDGIVRRFGAVFYDKLLAVAKDLRRK